MEDSEVLAYFPAEIMRTVQSVFVGSYEHVLGNVMPGTTRNNILKFVSEIMLHERVYLMVTPEGIKRAIEKVFTDDAIRNFIFDLSFTFFSRWGGIEDNHVGLAKNLAAGIGLKTYDGLENNAIPDIVFSKLANVEESYKILIANKWMIMIVLIKLYITVDWDKILEKTPGQQAGNVITENQ